MHLVVGAEGALVDLHDLVAFVSVLDVLILNLLDVDQLCRGNIWLFSTKSVLVFLVRDLEITV